jgi:hypothetical protein
LGKQFSELWIFRFFFQIFGELHKSFSTFCRFNHNSIGKCILQLPITQNLDMCRHNISFLMTNPNFHVPATWLITVNALARALSINASAIWSHQQLPNLWRVEWHNGQMMIDYDWLTFWWWEHYINLVPWKIF